MAVPPRALEAPRGERDLVSLGAAARRARETLRRAELHGATAIGATNPVEKSKSLQLRICAR